ncbi:hypothetical protein J2W27_002700 [Variovorax boronicumulans]|uniref:SAVED domain-containing protein n=1 Tax=Variovorax boronicumulans TaxID=436515 RepID=UPI00277F03BB|nr:SAVED domain-containing protein [Variovorax boronicumulans]MDP9910588.1 hypothetical protein [Variovorax boronicumulans]
MSEFIPLSDAEMAAAISKTYAASGELLVIANGYTAKLAARSTTGDSWTSLGRGDFGLECGAAVEPLAAASQLWWQDITSSPAAFDLSTVTPAARSPNDVAKWLSNAETLTTSIGRGASPTSEDMNYLGYLAAWRCQFWGCGKDLKKQTATGVASKSSYFAHIIASSPNGPRGDPLLSEKLSSDIENFLLLCDECHRRIDRQDPERFTVPVLRTMREQSVVEVQRLLASLQYKEAVPVIVMGNISAQAPHFVAREAEEALWTRKLRMAAGHPHTFFENGWNQHDPHLPSYWSALFNSIQPELPQLRKLLRTSPSPGGGAHLAVFPVHGTSALILAGRVFGEASAVSLFQFRRERPVTAPGGRWAFDENAQPSRADKYYCRTLQEHAAGNEQACLIVSLTFSVSPTRLGAHVFENDVFKMGTIEVTADGKLHPDILASEADLDLVSRQLGEAVRLLQDEWHVKRVHLFVGAPATVCFKLGQKLQARHHALYRCYESAFGSNAPYAPTIDISNDEARVVGAADILRLT